MAGAFLVVEIERAHKDTLGAARVLAKRNLWLNFLNRWEDEASNNPAEALRRQYYNHQQTGFSKMARDAFKVMESEDRLDEWEALIKDIIK